MTEAFDAQAIKLRVARAQLGAALDLFIRDKDPLSVQALACTGSEVIEGLATTADISTFSTHILATFPDVDMRKIRYLRNQYWNAIKHFYQRDGVTARDDAELMQSFSDKANDAPLYMGWRDYMMLTKRLPVAAQVFQAWWYATNEEKLKSGVDPRPFRALFPKITAADRREQKRRLRRAAEKYRNDPELLADPRTEREPLLIKVEY